MERTMQKCSRVSGAYNFGFAIADCGLIDPREDARRCIELAEMTQSRVCDYPLVISALPWFVIQSKDKAPLNARKALNGEAFELLNGDNL